MSCERSEHGVQQADVLELATDLLGALAERDVPLAPMTTYRVGGSAAIFARPRTVADLHLVSAAVRATGLAVLIVGRGSNLLVADTGFRGIAVSLSMLGTGIDVDREMVCAGGAVALPVLARRTVAAGLTGFEWAVGVPGSVGGGVRMNAGGHGADIASCLRSVELFDLGRDESVSLAASSLGLRFRGSAIGDLQIVVSATLELAAGDGPASQVVLDDIVRWRREHQPGGQNAGSVFVNPVPGEITAGALIDQVGLRGFCIGTAHVSEKHANFIQASVGGSAADVRKVIETVRTIVAERTGFVLRSEVRLVGFADGEVLSTGQPRPGSLELHAGVIW